MLIEWEAPFSETKQKKNKEKNTKACDWGQSWPASLFKADLMLNIIYGDAFYFQTEGPSRALAPECLCPCVRFLKIFANILRVFKQRFILYLYRVCVLSCEWEECGCSDVVYPV